MIAYMRRMCKYTSLNYLNVEIDNLCNVINGSIHESIYSLYIEYCMPNEDLKKTIQKRESLFIEKNH